MFGRVIYKQEMLVTLDRQQSSLPNCISLAHILWQQQQDTTTIS